jgi:hypothetical protein
MYFEFYAEYRLSNLDPDAGPPANKAMVAGHVWTKLSGRSPQDAPLHGGCGQLVRSCRSGHHVFQTAELSSRRVDALRHALNLIDDEPAFASRRINENAAKAMLKLPWRALARHGRRRWAILLRRSAMTAIRLDPEARRHGSSPPRVLRQPVMLVCGFGRVAA